MLCAAEDGTTRTARQLSGAHHIEVRTDPQSGDYVVVSGAQKVEQTARSAAELGVETLLDPDEQKRLEADPFYKLERDAPRAAQRKARQPWQAALQQKQEGLWADDYAMSQGSAAPTAAAAAAAADAAANAAKGIRVPLVAERPDDVAAARAVEFGAAKRKRSDAARGEKRLPPRRLGARRRARARGGGGRGGAPPTAAAAAVARHAHHRQAAQARRGAAAAAARGRAPPLRVEQAVPAYLIDRRKPARRSGGGAGEGAARRTRDYPDDSDG